MMTKILDSYEKDTYENSEGPVLDKSQQLLEEEKQDEINRAETNKRETLENITNCKIDEQEEQGDILC
jgi:hypothetical protein